MKVILFGATGNLGKAIAKELIKQGHDLTVVVRNEQKAKEMSTMSTRQIVADVCNLSTLQTICNNQEVVISALGKSVSPNDKSKPTFREVDYLGNSNILEEAIKSKVKKLIYISAFHSEKYQHLEYFKVHHDFSVKVMESGIDYSIIKPPAIFSAFLDMIQMAQKGQLFNIGKGEKLTNPIYEADLAEIVVNSIQFKNVIIEAGGTAIYTRKQLNEIVQYEINGNKKLRTIPLGLFKIFLPVLRILNKNTYDKFAFFFEVMQQDTIAPQLGKMNFETYVKLKKSNVSLQ